ncbi:MAG TPA: amidase [Dehalococcoidia bacterium]|nr:amidase [Dehalococcoidia bacterium]
MTTSTELTSLSLAEAADLVSRREVSSVDLTDACIERAERLEPALHTYITRTFETARSEAKAAQEASAAGRYLGPLHGVPFAIKDLYETAGVRTTAGSKPRESHVPAEDAEAVARLKAAGIVMLGKLNLHEWAMGGTNVNVFYPTPRNPWDTSRITGGSSGGSGAALAARTCYGSLGTDTRGSIRIPASLCGITGIKATYGRVSIRGVIPLSWSLDHAGPMARTARDCALILSAIAGFDPQDPTTVDLPVPDYAAALDGSARGLRVGVARNFFFDEGACEPEIRASVHAAADVLRDLGATVSEVEVPGPLEYAASGAFFADSLAYHEAALRDDPARFSEPILKRLNGPPFSGVDYSRDRYRQLELKRGLELLFREIDLLLTPTSCIPPLKIDEAPAWAPGAILARNTSPFNVAGLPTISLPCGFDSQGLPIGMQLTGRWWDEATVLRAADAYQRVTDWHTREPSLG